MHDIQHDDPLDASIMAADPLARNPIGVVDGALTELLHTLPRAALERRRPAWRRARPSSVVVATAALAAVGSVAAAGILHARTGATVPDDELAAAGPGEVLRIDAPDFLRVFTEVAADIPFAPGAALEGSFAWRSVQVKGDLQAMSVTVGAARGYVARSAGCSWVDYWATGDTAARAEAIRQVDGLLRSDAVVAVDPHPSMSGYTNDNSQRVPTIFGPLTLYVQSMRAGDESLLRRQVADAHWCFPQDMSRTGWVKQ